MGTFFKKIARHFVKELKNIIFAALLAIIIWFAISMQIFPDIVSHVSDISVKINPTDYMITNSLNISEGYGQKISVKISGKRYEIGNLGSSDFEAYADLSGVTGVGEYTVPVQVRPVRDIECRIDENSSLTVKIKVEKIISKRFSAEDGNLFASADDVVPLGDMKIETVLSEPSEIVLTGDEKTIESIKRVEIRSVFAGEATSSLSSKGQIILHGENGVIENSDIKFGNENFKVNVTLYKHKDLPLTLKFTNVPENFDLSSLKYHIYPEKLTISSPDASVDFQDKFEVGIINLGELTTKYLLNKLTLPITLPEGYKNVSGNTYAMVDFEADDYTFMSFTVQKDNIIVKNAPDDFDVEVLTNEITVRVTGPASEVETLTPSNIYATVDLMGMTLTEGIKELIPQFTIKRSKVKSWITDEDYTVSIRIASKLADAAEE